MFGHMLNTVIVKIKRLVFVFIHFVGNQIKVAISKYYRHRSDSVGDLSSINPIAFEDNLFFSVCRWPATIEFLEHFRSHVWLPSKDIVSYKSVPFVKKLMLQSKLQSVQTVPDLENTHPYAANSTVVMQILQFNITDQITMIRHK